MATGPKSILRMTKDEIIAFVEKSGCKMLQGKLSGKETRKEIVEYLIHCDCPAIRKLFK